MKIIIICGSLEPGRDGVGDYSRRLAGELIRQGHEAQIISLNDKYVSSKIVEKQNDFSTEIICLRLPSKYSWTQRIFESNIFISDYNPEWISLQFVPFSFHEKGLPIGLGSKLKKLGIGRKLHVMFHEIWGGNHMNAPKKAKILGFFQKRIIKSLCSEIKFDVIHTQSTVYLKELNAEAISAYRLPLFSNIPNLNSLPDFNEWTRINAKDLELIVFGTIHAKAPIEDFIKEVGIWSRNNKVNLVLNFIGNCGPEQDKWLSLWEQEGFQANVFGSASAESISMVLKRSAIGITSTSYLLTEKSGSVCAMLEHGLPVLCISHLWKPRNFCIDHTIPGVFEYKSGNFEIFISQLQNGKFKFNEINNLTSIAKNYIDCLVNSGK